MNILAHLYLSSSKNILIGNFIADAVKGNKYTSYPIEIQTGILLHREIDTFTDNHPIFKKSKSRLNNRYRHYKGVITDIFYDHFLAKNWHHYSHIPLAVYAHETYLFLNSNRHLYPQKIFQLLDNMTTYNWLEAYADITGIENVLNGMNSRTQGISMMNLAINDLNLHYKEFQTDFTEFFRELTAFSTLKTTALVLK